MRPVPGGRALHLLPRRLPLRALILGFATLGVFRVAVLVIGVQHGQMVDRYYQIGHAAGRPYADYSLEYPPLLVAVVKLLALVTPDTHAFTAGIIVISLLAEATVAVLLWRAWSADASFWYLCIDTLGVALFMMRLDLLSVAVVVAAIVAARRSRPALAAVAIVAAIGLRLWPAPLALLLLPLIPAAERRRYVITGVVALGVLFAGWLSLGGVAGIEQVVTFRGAIGWQIESVAGSVVRLFTGEPAVMQSGAYRFGHVPPAEPLLMQLGAAALIIWVVVHVRTRRDLGVAWVACVGALLIASPLFSPQYVAWLVPAGAIALVSGDMLVAVAVVGVALGTLLEFGVYNEVVAGWAQGTAYLLVRNALLVVAVLTSVTTLARQRRHEPAEFSPATVRRSLVATAKQ